MAKGRTRCRVLKLQSAEVAVENTLQKHGLLSPEHQAESGKLSTAMRELQGAKDDELPEYDAAWYPAIWKAYTEFGPSSDWPHGHGGFLSPQNGTCLTAGPLSPDIVGAKSPDGGRQAARKRARDASTTSVESSGQATSLDGPRGTNGHCIRDFC